MSSSTCATCGRARPSSDGDGAHNSPGMPFLRFDSSAAAWASFDGQDLCPNCQTPAQRREAAFRAASMIEREIQRRQGQGLPPDPYEAGLVAYAMALRDRADADSPDGDSSPSPVPALGQAAYPRDWSPASPNPHDPVREHTTQPCDEAAPHLRVAFTGAFLTGLPLAVRIDSYDEVRTQLARVLQWPQWRTTDLQTHVGTYETAGGGGFTEALPLVVIRRDGHDLIPMLAESFDGSGCAGSMLLGAFPPLCTADPVSFHIDFYDLGVAVLTAWFNITATKGACLESMARAVKELSWLRAGKQGPSPLATVVQRIAMSTNQQYVTAVRETVPAELRATWRSSAPTPGSPAIAEEERANERGQLLWLHPINILCIEDEASPVPQSTSKRAHRAAKALVPAFGEMIGMDRGVFAAGIGSSAVVVRPRSDYETVPVRLTELHWAYYALYMEMDRKLLRVLNQEKWTRTQTEELEGLEADVDNVFADYKRVTDARARLDSDLISRGGDEIAIWRTIAKVQRFDTIVKAVEHKLGALEKLAQHRVSQAAAIRERRIVRTLAWLSSLTIVTVAAAITGFFLDSLYDENRSVVLRVFIIGGALTLAVLLHRLIFRWRLPKPSPFDVDP